MNGDVYKSISSCHSCVKPGTILNHKRHVQRFLAIRSLDLVAKDILCELSKMAKDNQHVVIISYRYYKLTRAVLNFKITRTTVACILFDAWVFSTVYRHVFLQIMVHTL